MTVRTSAPIVFTPGADFLRTDRGITWGIKVTAVGDIRMVSVFERSGDAWVSAVVLGDILTMPPGANVREWFINTCLPALNDWLAKRFPALSGPPSTDPADQLDRLIVGSLRVDVGADGTLSARVG